MDGNKGIGDLAELEEKAEMMNFHLQCKHKLWAVVAIVSICSYYNNYTYNNLLNSIITIEADFQQKRQSLCCSKLWKGVHTNMVAAPELKTSN